MAIALGRRSARTSIGQNWRDFDWYMLTMTLVLMSFGIIAIWSAWGLDATGQGNAIQQMLYGAIGLAVMLVISAIDYRFFAALAWPLYALGIGLLVSVHVIGTTITGAQSWIYFGGVSFQPSEVAKLSTLIALAAFVSSRGAAMRDLGNIIVAALILAVPMFLVLAEPDLGSAGVYAMMWLAVMVVARTRTAYFVGGLLATPAILWFAWNFVLQDYQRARLLVSYDPNSDPLGGGYNILQAWISIGAGGLFGEGLAGGTQSQYNLLVVRESDFIFAHVSGMFGFLGMMALFTCYMILLWRVLRVVELSRDHFGQCLAMGIFGVMFFQAFLNIGTNVGIMPVTGVTLPLISQGSTSLWTFLMAQGILQSILLGHRKFAFQRGL